MAEFALAQSMPDDYFITILKFMPQPFQNGRGQTKADPAKCLFKPKQLQTQQL